MEGGRMEDGREIHAERSMGSGQGKSYLPLTETDTSRSEVWRTMRGWAISPGEERERYLGKGINRQRTGGEEREAY